MLQDEGNKATYSNIIELRFLLFAPHLELKIMVILMNPFIQ